MPLAADTLSSSETLAGGESRPFGFTKYLSRLGQVLGRVGSQLLAASAASRNY